jgi:hypothetical protein
MRAVIESIRRPLSVALPRGRRLAGAALAAGLLGIAACGVDRSTGPRAGLAGTYQLSSVNDGALNTTVQYVDPNTGHLLGMYRFHGGTLRVSDDNTWSMTIDYDDLNTNRELSDDGSYARNGDEIHFSSAEFGDEFPATLNGGTLDVRYDFIGNGVLNSRFAFQR